MKIQLSRIFMICVVFAASTSFASPFLIIGWWYISRLGA